MKIDSYIKTLAASTPTDLIAAVSGVLPQFKYARAIQIRCPSGNTNDLSLGSEQRQNTLVAKGTVMLLPEINRAGQSGKYELAKIMVSSAHAGDTVEITLLDCSDS